MLPSKASGILNSVKSNINQLTQIKGVEHIAYQTESSLSQPGYAYSVPAEIPIKMTNLGIKVEILKKKNQDKFLRRAQNIDKIHEQEKHELVKKLKRQQENYKRAQEYDKEERAYRKQQFKKKDDKIKEILDKKYKS